MSMTSVSSTAATGVQIQLQRDQQKLATSQSETAVNQTAVARSQAAVAKQTTRLDCYA